MHKGAPTAIAESHPMRRPATLAVLLALLLVAPAERAGAAAPPPGDISDNLEFIANIPELKTVISLNFLGDTMFASTTLGLYSYDVSDPAAPELLGALPMYIWQNEDMDIDPERKLAFLSRDPRGFTTPASGGHVFPYGAVHIIDISNPHAMVQVGFFTVPAGHTSSCINDCRYLWTGGPFANAQIQPDYNGRPIYATDISDPADPQPCPEPIDIGRNDGVTDYAHDVQVDAMGIAWVSGAGGVRGYWTRGEHRNPLTGEVEEATGCDPIPYAGGGTPEEATPSRFMHNSWRNLEATIPGEDDPETPGDDTRGHVLYATEENLSSNCASSGRFATYDLRGSYDGQGWRHDSEPKFRMRALDTWTPEEQEGATGCASAHYFDEQDGLLAYGFYGQGTRLLDVSDPTDVRQIGYFRPDGGNVWGATWRDDLIFVADNARGVDILRFTGSGEAPEVAAPPADDVVSTDLSPVFGGMCPRTAAGLAVA